MAVYATRNGQRQPGAPSGDSHVTQRAAISCLSTNPGHALPPSGRAGPRGEGPWHRRAAIRFESASGDFDMTSATGAPPAVGDAKSVLRPDARVAFRASTRPVL